jgi:hypothetical protein
VQKPGCDEYYAAYHRYENGNYSTRHVAIDRVVFGDNGLMLPIIQTWAGVPARPGNAPCYNPRDLGNGTYRILSRITANNGQGLAVDITGCGQNPGSDVRTWTPSNCLGQRWSVTWDGNGYYEILSQQPTRHSLDLDNCNLGLGANVKIWNDTNNDCQRWRIEPLGAGWYRILSKQSGHSLDIAGGSNVPGANVQMWEWNSTNAQQWRFEAVAPARSADDISYVEEPFTNAVFPNPVTTESFTVNFYSTHDQKINVEMIDALSRKSSEKSFGVKKGANELPIQSTGLSNGIHLITIKGEKSTPVLLKVLINK